jgi:hypothetical protein
MYDENLGKDHDAAIPVFPCASSGSPACSGVRLGHPQHSVLQQWFSFLLIGLSSFFIKASAASGCTSLLLP